MTIVFNKTKEAVFIQELNQKIPADGRFYKIPPQVANNYVDVLFVVPDLIINNIEAKNKELDRVNNLVHSLQVERNQLFKRSLRYKKMCFEDPYSELWKRSHKKCTIDMLYPFHFNDGVERERALKRLRCSIQSIVNQEVNICVCNTSKRCIENDIKDICNVRYIHKPLDVETYCKPQTINYGVCMLVTTPYFILSDIDLIYPPTFIKSIKKHVDFSRPVRVVFHNYNLGDSLYSNKYKDYVKSYEKNQDVSRTQFGIAPGNGLIHLESFYKIKGFDTRYKGYGLEDADFNFRIKYICDYREVDDDKLNTYHIFHYIVNLPDLDGNQKIFNETIKEIKKKYKKKGLDCIVTQDKNWNLQNG